MCVSNILSYIGIGALSGLIKKIYSDRLQVVDRGQGGMEGH